MKIALLGYGKMGMEIEQIALQRNHQAVLKINEQNLEELSIENLKICDVAIEFSTPQTAIENILLCFEAGVPIVCGTTGWYEKLNFVKETCRERNATFLYASNFSIGVNILFEINKQLAEMMNKIEGYTPLITEWHHIHKKDKPSGTAITLANGIMLVLKNKTHFTVDSTETLNNAINIICKREDEIIGTHLVQYDSEIDSLEIKHTAHNRKGFATGAVLAAEWLMDKKGFYEMSDFMKTFVA